MDYGVNVQRCKTIITTKEHIANLHVCVHCGHHDRIGSNEYFNILFDNNKFKELDKNMSF